MADRRVPGGYDWHDLADADEAQADRAARALIGRQPRWAPPAGFSARIVAATRRSWPVATGAVEPRAETRPDMIVTSGVIAGAIGLTLAPAALMIALFAVDASAIVGALARGCVWLVSWLQTGVSVWELLARVGDVATTVAVSPTGTRVLVAGLLTAWIALAGLSRLLPEERSER